MSINTFAADVVSGREEDWSEFDDQSSQEASFRVLENLDSFQCVKVNVQRNLRLQFVRKQRHGLLFVAGFLAQPQVVEPLDDAVLHAQRHTTQ